MGGHNSKGLTTDEFAELISDRVMFGKAKVPEIGTPEFERFVNAARVITMKRSKHGLKAGRSATPKYSPGSSINLERLDTNRRCKHFLTH